MNGPQIICAGCEKPTTPSKPICDDCMRGTGLVPTAYCALCEAARLFALQILPAKNGLHMTEAGGYVGRCTA